MTIKPGYSLKELDESLGRRKGYAFRLFKTRLGELQEGRDFRVLEHGRDQSEIQALKTAARIYPQSINVVLLSAECFEQLRKFGQEQSE